MNNVIIEYVNLLVPNHMQRILMGIGGVLGTCCSFLFGGWNDCLIWLVVMIAIDYVTGTAASLKTGKWCSSSGFRGIFKKCFIFLVVALCHGLDHALYHVTHNEFLMMCCIFAYLVNEFGSIIENIDRIGYGAYLPAFIKPALKALREKENQIIKEKIGNDQDLH